MQWQLQALDVTFRGNCETSRSVQQGGEGLVAAEIQAEGNVDVHTAHVCNQTDLWTLTNHTPVLPYSFPMYSNRICIATWQLHFSSHTESYHPERRISDLAALPFLSAVAMTSACPPCQTPLFHFQKPCTLFHFSFPGRSVCVEFLGLNKRTIWFIVLVFIVLGKSCHLQIFHRLFPSHSMFS